MDFIRRNPVENDFRRGGTPPRARIRCVASRLYRSAVEHIYSQAGGARFGNKGGVKESQKKAMPHRSFEEVVLPHLDAAFN